MQTFLNYIQIFPKFSPLARVRLRRRSDVLRVHVVNARSLCGDIFSRTNNTNSINKVDTENRTTRIRDYKWL